MISRDRASGSPKRKLRNKTIKLRFGILTAALAPTALAALIRPTECEKQYSPLLNQGRRAMQCNAGQCRGGGGAALADVARSMKQINPGPGLELRTSPVHLERAILKRRASRSVGLVVHPQSWPVHREWVESGSTGMEYLAGPVCGYLGSWHVVYIGR